MNSEPNLVQNRPHDGGAVANLPPLLEPTPVLDPASYVIHGSFAGGRPRSGATIRAPAALARSTSTAAAARGYISAAVHRFGIPLWILLAIMTRCDYYMTVSGIRIADLKSHLSEHLRKVRGGSSLTILDRDTPIARIVPWKAAYGSLKLRAPLPGALKLQRVPLPPPLRLRGDILKLLMEERQGDR
jgi:antitoxin (DNA-binding transcriptional repressor) of toxin-antitoxin stability system